MATVGSTYARAIFELGQEKNQLTQAVADLKEYADLLKGNAQLRAVLSGGGIDRGVREAVLADVMKAAGTEGLAKNALELLASRARLAALPELVTELQRLVERSQGVLGGTVRSAVELSPEELGKLEAALAKRVGQKVRLDARVDPSLLGGVVATVGGKTFDASLRSQLERFKQELI